MPIDFRVLLQRGLMGLAGLCALVAAVQAQPAPLRAPPPWPAVQPAGVAVDDYRLGPGDTLGVLVFQNPDLSLDVRVSESGLISYPLIGSLSVGGQTLIEAQAALARALRSGGYVRDPQVSLVLRQIRGNQVSVLGQVSRPGRFALEAFSTRVSDMLAAAGGITQAGDDWLVVTGSRDGRAFRKEIDVPSLFGPQPSSDDIVLAPGDTLYVGKAPQFYIDGQAQKPGAHRLERGMTVRQALAAGGGPTARGSQNRLRVYRKDAQGRLVEAVPQMNDLVRPDDVIHVGESLF